MKLHPEWQSIIRYAWSARLIIAACVLDGLSVTLQAFLGFGWASVTLAVLAGFASAGALVARVILQARYPVAE